MLLIGCAEELDPRVLTLEVCEVRLLVKRRVHQPEGVHHVIDLLLLVVGALLGLLGGCVSTRVCITAGVSPKFSLLCTLTLRQSKSRRVPRACHALRSLMPVS